MYLLKKLANFELEKASAIVTWLLVTTTAVFFLSQEQEAHALSIGFLTFCCCSYLFLWLKISSITQSKTNRSRITILMIFMYINIIVIFFLSPYSYVAIFTVIWSALTPHILGVRKAMLLSPLWSLPLWLIYAYYWGERYAIVTAGLFWTFNLFAIVMVNTTIKETKAKEKAEQLNIELQSTRQLLRHAASQAERTRIARNIHDLLGHHLTALTINLQVASRQLEKADEDKQQIKQNIEQCHSLAKLLLSDVREAVSDIRDKSKIDLPDALKAITQSLPRLDIKLEIDDQLVINDLALAKSVIRLVQESLTNTLKHSQASQCSIQVNQASNNLNVSITDNGEPVSQWQEGNGMAGMRERVEMLGGKITFELTETGFTLTAVIPIQAND